MEYIALAVVCSYCGSEPKDSSPQTIKHDQLPAVNHNGFVPSVLLFEDDLINQIDHPSTLWQPLLGPGNVLELVDHSRHSHGLEEGGREGGRREEGGGEGGREERKRRQGGERKHEGREEERRKRQQQSYQNLATN